MKCKDLSSNKPPPPPPTAAAVSAPFPFPGVDTHKLLPGRFPPFKLERYICEAYDTYPDLRALCSSDAQTWTMKEILDLADDDVKQAWSDLLLAYQDPKGHPDLIAEVAKLHQVGQDGVYIVVPRQGIYNTLNILVPYLRSRDKMEPHAIVAVPAFQITLETLLAQDIEVSEWHARDTPNGWKYFMDEFKALLKPSTKIVAVNFPHCPTGFIPTEEDWLELINICKSRNIFLFSDEMYNYIPLDDGKPLTTACSLMDNAISLFGMSKTFGLSGLRLGWLCSRNTDVMSLFKCYGDYLSLGCSASAQLLALMALRRMDVTIGRNHQLGLRNLDILEAFIKRHGDVLSYHRPQSGTTAYVRLHSGAWLMDQYGTGTARGVCDRLIEQHQLLILPSFVYGCNDLYIRFGFIRFDFEANLQILENIINAARQFHGVLSIKSPDDITPKIIDVTDELTDSTSNPSKFPVLGSKTGAEAAEVSDDSSDVSSDDVSDDISTSSGVSSSCDDAYLDILHNNDPITCRRSCSFKDEDARNTEVLI